MRNSNILLVENSVTEQLAIRVVLDHHSIPYYLTVAATGEEAWEIITRSPGKPEIIIASLDLPGMSGFEFAVQVRSNHNLASCRILLLSSDNDDEDKALAAKIGIDGIVQKSRSVYSYMTSRELVRLIVNLRNG